MAIQFSVLIVLHSCLVLVTTAEDYKCLPLVLRKACCWINETYAARNVIVLVSILINFLGAMINIVRFTRSLIRRRQNRSAGPRGLTVTVALSQLWCDFDKSGGFGNQTFNESAPVPDICFYPEVAPEPARLHLRRVPRSTNPSRHLLGPGGGSGL